MRLHYTSSKLNINIYIYHPYKCIYLFVHAYIKRKITRLLDKRLTQTSFSKGFGKKIKI